jgi:hypothetical protein
VCACGCGSCMLRVVVVVFVAGIVVVVVVVFDMLNAMCGRGWLHPLVLSGPCILRLVPITIILYQFSLLLLVVFLLLLTLTLKREILLELTVRRFPLTRLNYHLALCCFTLASLL